MVFPLKTRNSAQEHPKNAQDKVFLFLQNIYPWSIKSNSGGAGGELGQISQMSTYTSGQIFLNGYLISPM